MTPNTTPQNGYKAFFKDKTCEVYANSSHEAQKKAAALFKARKQYDVSVILCEKAGESVTHSTAILD